MQATGAAMSVVLTCAWWAPTETSVVAVRPLESTGGAAFTLTVPWQDVQVSATTSTLPFTWVVRFTEVPV